MRCPQHVHLVEVVLDLAVGAAGSKTLRAGRRGEGAGLGERGADLISAASTAAWECRLATSCATGIRVTSPGAAPCSLPESTPAGNAIVDVRGLTPTLKCKSLPFYTRVGFQWRLYLGC